MAQHFCVQDGSAGARLREILKHSESSCDFERQHPSTSSPVPAAHAHRHVVLGIGDRLAHTLQDGGYLPPSALAELQAALFSMEEEGGEASWAHPVPQHAPLRALLGLLRPSNSDSTAASPPEFPSSQEFDSRGGALSLQSLKRRAAKRQWECKQQTCGPNCQGACCMCVRTAAVADLAALLKATAGPHDPAAIPITGRPGLHGPNSVTHARSTGENDGTTGKTIGSGSSLQLASESGSESENQDVPPLPPLGVVASSADVRSPRRPYDWGGSSDGWRDDLRMTPRQHRLLRRVQSAVGPRSTQVTPVPSQLLPHMTARPSLLPSSGQVQVISGHGSHASEASEASDCHTLDAVRVSSGGASMHMTRSVPVPDILDPPPNGTDTPLQPAASVTVSSPRQPWSQQQRSLDASRSERVRHPSVLSRVLSSLLCSRGGCSHDDIVPVVAFDNLLTAPEPPNQRGLWRQVSNNRVAPSDTQWRVHPPKLGSARLNEHLGLLGRSAGAQRLDVTSMTGLARGPIRQPTRGLVTQCSGPAW